MLKTAKTVSMLIFGILCIEIGHSNLALSESCTELFNKCARKEAGDCSSYSSEKCGYYACMAGQSLEKGGLTSCEIGCAVSFAKGDCTGSCPR